MVCGTPSRLIPQPAVIDAPREKSYDGPMHHKWFSGFTWDRVIRSAVYLLFAAALFGIVHAAWDDYRGVMDVTGPGPGAAAKIAVKATDPAEFHYQILVRLLLPGAAMMIGTYILLRLKWWRLVSPDSLDFAGSDEAYDPETEMTVETGCTDHDTFNRCHSGAIIRH